jgi:hypothetical protein
MPHHAKRASTPQNAHPSISGVDFRWRSKRCKRGKLAKTPLSRHGAFLSGLNWEVNYSQVHSLSTRGVNQTSYDMAGFWTCR